jgi:hypothetical protein
VPISDRSAEIRDRHFGIALGRGWALRETDDP